MADDRVVELAEASRRTVTECHTSDDEATDEAPAMTTYSMATTPSSLVASTASG